MPDLRSRGATPWNPEGSFRASAASGPGGPESCRRARSGGLRPAAGRARWSSQKGKRRSRSGAAATHAFRVGASSLTNSAARRAATRPLRSGTARLAPPRTGCYLSSRLTRRLPKLESPPGRQAVVRSVRSEVRRHYRTRVRTDVVWGGRRRLNPPSRTSGMSGCAGTTSPANAVSTRPYDGRPEVAATTQRGAVFRSSARAQTVQCGIEDRCPESGIARDVRYGRHERENLVQGEIGAQLAGRASGVSQ